MSTLIEEMAEALDIGGGTSRIDNAQAALAVIEKRLLGRVVVEKACEAGQNWFFDWIEIPYSKEEHVRDPKEVYDDSIYKALRASLKAAKEGA